MWEEDPRWQQGHFQLLVWGVGIIGLVAVLTSAFAADWAFIRYYLIGLVVALAALSIYAEVVWIIGHAFFALVRLYRKVFHEDRGG